MKKNIFLLGIIFVLGFFSLQVNKSYANSFIDLSGFLNDRYSPIENTVKDNVVANRVVLGNEQITKEYSYLINGKRVGMVTNQTGLLPDGRHISEVMANYKGATLTAFYAPEHGIDGKAKAGEWVKSYVDKNTGLPVYSIYGKTRKPSPEMMAGIDVMLFDMQDIGGRSYTFISSLYKCMEAAKENNKKIVILDRPNPLGGLNIEGFVLKPEYSSFVGIDEIPMQHGMTIGELAQFFNRKIGADLTVVPMKNYKRSMVWQDTGLGNFPQTSPNIPTLESAFCYLMTGAGESTGFAQSDKFLWGGGKGYNSINLANAMNSYGFEGVEFIPENKGDRGGVRIKITDYTKVNPGKIGYYLLATANLQKPLAVKHFDAKGKQTMFLKVHGSKEFGNSLLSKKSPLEIENMYRSQVEEFKINSSKYYIYN